MPKQFNYDAGSGLAFLTSQLSYLEKKLFEKQYKAITYNQLIPVSNEAGEHATSITYFYMDGKAVAKFVGTKSLDVPISEIGTKKVEVPVELAATGYNYSDEELRQAIFLGRPLPQLKSNASRRAYEELLQKTSMTGDTEYNLPGFINNPNVTASAVANPGSGTEFSNKTPEQIIKDINDLFSDINVDTNQVESADTLALPTAQWNYLAGTLLSALSGITIMQAIINSSPFLKSVSDIIATPELAGAGAGGTDRMMAYTKDMDKVVFHVPMPLKFSAPQRKGRGFEVPGEFKCGGVEFRYPGSARYADGI